MFCAALMVVVVIWMLQVSQNYIRQLEQVYNIHLEQEISTERIPVEEHFARYLANLPVPEVVPEETKAQEIATVEEQPVAQIANNELVNRVKGMTPTIRNLNTSSYCPCEQCCGKTDGITASGEKVRAWYTVAAGKEYAIGTIIYIPALADKPNEGWFIVQDRGGAIKNGKLDIFLNTHNEALEYGRKTLECYIYEF